MYNLLIVDDEAIICEGLSRIINWKEHKFNIVGFACNGREAIEKIKSSRINLVVTDIRMPVMDGLELSKQIREYGSKIRIIIISGYSDFQYAKKAIEYGVGAYLLKPVIPDELTDQVIKIRHQLDEQSVFENRYIDDLKSNENKKMIDCIIDYVDGHYCDDINLSLIADKFFINAAYLGQLFKETTGMPFAQYINKKKINMAKQLCMRSDLKIYEIIEKAGFKNPEYFYRQFKRYEGVTFAEFRDNLLR
jgi:two-component system response regulator YesN